MGFNVQSSEILPVFSTYQPSLEEGVFEVCGEAHAGLSILRPQELWSKERERSPGIEVFIAVERRLGAKCPAGSRMLKNSLRPCTSFGPHPHTFHQPRDPPSPKTSLVLESSKDGGRECQEEPRP